MEEKLGVLTFNGQIDDAVAQRIASAFAHTYSQGVTRIIFGLNTSGGLISAGVFLYHFIRGLPVPVTTHNMGMVASIGVPVYLAGETRLGVAGCIFQFHPISMGQLINADHDLLQGNIDMLKLLDSQIEGILAADAALGPKLLKRRRGGDVLVAGAAAMKLSLYARDAAWTVPPGAILINIT